MPGPDLVLAALAARQGGLFHRDDARAAGIDSRVLARRVARDLLVERQPNVFQAASSPFGLEERERAALLSLGPTAMLSHDNAAWRWGFAARTPAGVIITVPWQRGEVRLDGVEVVRSRRTDGIKRMRNGWSLTCPPRTWIDLGRTRTEAELTAALATAMQRKLVTRKELDAHLALAHNKAGTGLVRRVLPHFDEKWESQLSARVGQLLLAAALDLVAGYEVSHDSGERLAILDFADVQRKVAVEADGWYYHGSALQQQRDKQRDRALARRGWLVIRFTTDDILHRPLQVLEEIHAVLQARTAA
jgi:hypothetical protein